jgi:hypothetical protein
MCKSVYWSRVVNPQPKGGDHQKPEEETPFFSGWSTGQPQFHFYRVAKKKEEEKTTRQNRKNSRFGVDRLTTPDSTESLSGGIRWSPRRAGGLTTPDHLGEVTL